jgi:hypothetical protein
MSGRRTNGNATHVPLDERIRAASDRAPASKSVFLECVSFRQSTGESIAFPYSQLVFVSMPHEGSLTFHFGSHSVTVKGTLLRPLYERTLVRMLDEIAEEPMAETASDGETTVMSIDVKRNQEVNQNRDHGAAGGSVIDELMGGRADFVLRPEGD